VPKVKRFASQRGGAFNCLIDISLIKKDYGYSIYYAIDFHDIGIIDKNNNITWKQNGI